MQPLHIKELRKKHIRKLISRRNEIYTLQRDLKFIPLEKPERYGWFKELLITDKIERYQQNDAMREIFSRIKKRYWGRTKEKAEELWQHQTSNYFIYNNLPTITKKQYYNLSVSAQKLCTPFRYKTERKNYKTRFYIRIPSSVFTIKYARAYITHYKEIDPLLESELDLIDQQFLKPGYYNLNQYSWKNDWELPRAQQQRLATKRELNLLKKYPLEDILNHTTNGKKT